MKERDEKIKELISGKVLGSLEEEELKELEEITKNLPELAEEIESFELAAAAINLTSLNELEPLPVHLKEKIIEEAEVHFEKSPKALNTEKKIPIFAWLGWVFAGLAIIGLAVNIYFTHFLKQESNNLLEREKILSMPDTIKLQWKDPKNPDQIIGDLAWNNAEQKGFVRFFSLPTNDPNKETYQLWIVDEGQKYPIDAGLFNVNTQGEIILPIDVRLKVEKPKMFVVTAEKPGGVVVSELKKVVAIAKIET
ncbi:MAG: anti-sigma factor [Acidobacteriota bacterium]|nr:anti-sigma factor [Pyrinomonadaceae bacterium]MDW8303395.1 anti-sigma factor [Acidobacteriota bacterium]